MMLNRNQNNKKNPQTTENKGYIKLFQTFGIKKYDSELKKTVKRTRNLIIYGKSIGILKT